MSEKAVSWPSMIALTRRRITRTPQSASGPTRSDTIDSTGCW